MHQAWQSCERYSKVGFGSPFLESPCSPCKPSTGLGGSAVSLSFATLAPHSSFLGLSCLSL